MLEAQHLPFSCSILDVTQSDLVCVKSKQCEHKQGTKHCPTKLTSTSAQSMCTQLGESKVDQQLSRERQVPPNIFVQSEDLQKTQPSNANCTQLPRSTDSKCTLHGRPTGVRPPTKVGTTKMFYLNTTSSVQRLLILLLPCYSSFTTLPIFFVVAATAQRGAACRAFLDYIPVKTLAPSEMTWHRTNNDSLARIPTT